MARPTAGEHGGHDEVIYVKSEPAGRSVEDAIPLLSDTDTDSDSDCDELPPMRKTEDEQRQQQQQQQHGHQYAGPAGSASASAAAVDLEDDTSAPDWQRATYFASQRAYADIAHYFRTGDAYFVSLTMTPWESSQDPVDIVDFGWAHLRPQFNPDGRQQHFDWNAQIAKAHKGHNTFAFNQDMYYAAERVCSAVNVKGARTSWRPYVVHYQPIEGKDCYNEAVLPHHKDNFLFRAFIDHIKPKRETKSNCFSRNIAGTYFDGQFHLMLEFNQFLNTLSERKPVFLLTHCMKQDVGFLSQLGIAWGNMNLSYPLSPWFTPKEDAEWLKEHRYWRSAWDFARPQQQSSESRTTSSQHPGPSTTPRDDRRDPSKEHSEREHRRHAKGPSSSHQPSQRERFVARDMPASDESSDDQRRHRARSSRPLPPPPPPPPPPRYTRTVSRRDFYRVRSIHIVDLYALIDILPHFNERSASYYPPLRPIGEPLSTTATERKETAEREKRMLKQKRAENKVRAERSMREVAKNERQYNTRVLSLQATAIRAGVLHKDDGPGEQFKWWNAGNEAMFMLAVLGRLVNDHPLPDRPPTPPPTPPPRPRIAPAASTSTPISAATSSAKRIGKQKESNSPTSLSGILQPPSRQREQAQAQVQKQQQKQQQQERRDSRPAAVEQPRRAVPGASTAKIGASAGRPALAASANAAVAQQAEASNAATRRRVLDDEESPVRFVPPSRQAIQQAAVSATMAAKRARPEVLAVEPELSSSELSSIESDESEPRVRRTTKRARIYFDPSSSDDDYVEAREDVDGDDTEGQGSQFLPFYTYMKEVFQKPAIYIAFAFRDGRPTDDQLITEVGYSILDASQADLRENLQMHTRHYIVKENQNIARPEAKADFAFASASTAAAASSVGSSGVKGVRHELLLPSGSRVATGRNIMKQIHSVLNDALKTDRRVFAVVANAEDTSAGHRTIIGQEEWPAFYDWRTHTFCALDSSQDDMFKSTGLLKRIYNNMSNSAVPGTRGRRMHTIEVRHLFAAVNSRDELAPAGTAMGTGAGVDGTTFQTSVDLPFPEVFRALGLKPENEGNMENAGNRAHYTLQAMLEFAYGPAEPDDFKNYVKSRREAQDANDVEAQI